MNNPHTYDMNQRIKYSRSEKVYLPGQIYPDLRVAMRRVEQVPSTTFDENGEKVITPNPKVYIYDTSGPYSAPNVDIDLKKGLPRLREPWILGRGDVERLPDVRWITCASSTSPCPSVPRPDAAARRCTTPSRASSPRRWNTWPSERI